MSCQVALFFALWLLFFAFGGLVVDVVTARSWRLGHLTLRGSLDGFLLDSFLEVVKILRGWWRNC
jgi:hypothetical protein